MEDTMDTSHRSQDDNPTGQPGPPSSCIWRIVQFPLVRIITATIWILLVLRLAYRITAILPAHYSMPISLLAVAIEVVAVYGAYMVFVRIIEKRPVREMAFSGAAQELGVGILLGAGLFTFIISILWALGVYAVEGFYPWTALLPAFVMAVSSGFIEEVLTRGVLFRISEEGLGTWMALLISSLIFGLLHGLNPNATSFTTLAIILEAGLLLCGAYVVTRRLWLVIGIHFSWNFVQGGIFGVPVSGYSFQGILDGSLTGPRLLSGGAFGVEASIVAVVLGTLVGIALFWYAHRKNMIIKPFWRRQIPQRPTDETSSSDENDRTIKEPMNEEAVGHPDP